MEEFTGRRAKLAAKMCNDSVALLFGSQTQIRNGDVEFSFRQNSNLYYLTGFCEPEVLMVLSKDSAGKVKYILMNRASDPEAEVWNGKRAGQKGALDRYSADEAYDIAELNNIMPKLLANKKVIYYPIASNKEVDQQVTQWLQELKLKIHKSGTMVPDTLIDILPLLYEMRLFKSKQEIEYMRKAATVSAAAHLKLMQTCKTVKYEYQLEATFNEHCLQAGCRGLAYNSIVASGNNACTLHYTENDQPIKNGDLVLVDAGAEYNYYASDITRTFPVNGKFNSAQRQIYELVLKAQLAGIEQVRPGNTWANIDKAILDILVSGLVELNILTGDVQQLINDKAYRKFYMHGSGHWLGLDVHDVGQYKINGDWRKFEPGMVLTIEPGIYIDQNSGVAEKWLGIGVRIEDDVLVTDSGNDVLSKDAPKQVDEIERAVL